MKHTKTVVKDEKKTVKKLTTHELIHLWCNFKIDKEVKSGNYRFTPTEFFVKESLKGVIKEDKYGTKIKRTILLEEFDNVGAFGSGINNWNISNAIPDKTNRIVLKKLPKIYTHGNSSKNTDVYHLQKEFIAEITQNLDALTFFKEFINNNRLSTKYYSIASLKVNKKEENFKQLLLLYNKETTNEFLKEKLNFKHCWVKYNGWGRNNNQYYYTDINLSPNKIFNEGLLTSLTTEELDTIQFKEWRNEWDKNPFTKNNSFRNTLKESRKIYDNSELKLAQEERYKSQQLSVEKEKLEKEAKRIQEQVKNFSKDIKEWREFNKNKFNTSWTNIMYPTLRVNDTQIETSMGATVTIQDAKKALSLFRKAIEGIKVGENMIGNFQFRRVNKKIFNVLVDDKLEQKECNYIEIGCHKIPDVEIFNFLKFYNLNW